MSVRNKAFQERAQRRSKSVGVLAIDATGKVVLSIGPSTSLLKFPETPQDSEENLEALHSLRCLFYSEIRDGTPMNKSVLKMGKGHC
jgi:hypothetical protein